MLECCWIPEVVVCGDWAVVRLVGMTGSVAPTDGWLRLVDAGCSCGLLHMLCM
jgi:hypothetical protein